MSQQLSSQAQTESLIDHTVLTVTAVAELVITGASQWYREMPAQAEVGSADSINPSNTATSEEKYHMLTATVVESNSPQSPQPAVTIVTKKGQCDCSLYESFPHRRRKCFFRNMGVLTAPPVQALAEAVQAHGKDAEPELVPAQVLCSELVGTCAAAHQASLEAWKSRRYIYNSSDSDSDASGTDVNPEETKREYGAQHLKPQQSRQKTTHNSDDTVSRTALQQSSDGLQTGTSALLQGSAILDIDHTATVHTQQALSFHTTQVVHAPSRFVPVPLGDSEPLDDQALQASLLEVLEMVSTVPGPDDADQTVASEGNTESFQHTEPSDNTLHSVVTEGQAASDSNDVPTAGTEPETGDNETVVSELTAHSALKQMLD